MDAPDATLQGLSLAERLAERHPLAAGICMIVLLVVVVVGVVCSQLQAVEFFDPKSKAGKLVAIGAGLGALALPMLKKKDEEKKP